MGLIKEYADRAIQTDTEPSPYVDPAVVLAALPVKRRGLAREAHTGRHNLIPTSSPTGLDSAHLVPRSPLSPLLSPLASRRVSKRKHARCPVEAAVNRRVVSMPENKTEPSSISFHGHGKRVVSMPDRFRPVLEPSEELFQSPSIVTGDSFGSYGGRNEHIHVLREHSDFPQTPSPPSSPDSLLIIAAGTQLPEGFLRRKYSPEPLIEEDEDWIAWASSPPRPIPALHGPLSLPYARCPSGAEGTIIEEPDNVAQMIWGLGPDDQAHNLIRTESVTSDPDTSQNAHFQGLSQVLLRSQKKRAPTQQVPKPARAQPSAHVSRARQNLLRTQRKAHDDNRPPSNVSLDIETYRDNAGAPQWDEEQSIKTNVRAADSLVNDADVFPVDNDRILEWQLTRLRQALRTSLVDMDAYSDHPGRLEPVIPATLAPGFPQSYPRIFLEPRPNESVSPAARQSSIEMAQQYRQQQLYKQALQKQKLQVQNFLPTPPNSSSPQWSSHFSPYLTYCSTFSPELVGSTEHTVPVSSQKHRPGSKASQYLSCVYDQHERGSVNGFDTSTNLTPAETAQIMPNVNPTASLRQSSSSSSTLAKYIKQLQALSPIAHFPMLQPVPASNVLLPPVEESTVSTFPGYRLPVVPTLSSPQSPQTSSQGSSYNARSVLRAHPIQRRLSSVPEEDNAPLEAPALGSPPRLQNQVTTDKISVTPSGTMGHQIHYFEVPTVDVTRKPAVLDVFEFESSLGASSIAFHHDTSPVKVRLPVTKEHGIREQVGGHPEQNKGHQHGHRKKHRYRKLKGPAALNEQVSTRGLAG